MKTLSVAVLTSALALSGFAEDAYVESDGTQALDTGYYVTAKTKIEVDFQFTGTHGQDTIFGAYSGKDLGVRFYIGGGYDTTGANWSFIYGYKNAANDPGWYNILSKDTTRRTAMIDFEHLTAAFAGKTSDLDASVVRADKTNSVSLAIFAQKKADGTFSEKSSIKLYSFKVWEAGVPVRDYVPCAKTVVDSTNGVSVVYGLYDKVGKSFVGSNNMASGFAAGGDGIMQLEEDDGYIESNGTDFMNLRAKFGPDTRIDCDFQLCEVVAQKRLVGVSGGGNTVGELYLNGGSWFATGIGDTPLYSRATSYQGDYKRHTYVLDRPANVSYLVTDGARHDVVTLTQTSGQNPGGETTKTSVSPMTLFGSGDAESGWGASGLAKMRVYGVRIYKANELIHDYRPLVKGGVAGFRDQVDGAFICGEKVSAFSAGGDVAHEDDDAHLSMVGADGSYDKRWFDTGYYPKSTSRIEFDYALLKAYESGKNWYLGSANGVSGTDHERFLCRFDGLDMKWQLGNNANGWKVLRMSADNTNVRRVSVLDAKNGLVCVMTAGYTNYWANTPYDGSNFTGNSLKIGAIWDGASGYPPVKFYGIRIFEDDVLKYDYRPFVKEGVAVLRDELGGGVLAVESTPTKSYPCLPQAVGAVESDRKYDAYLESDGTQAINTGYKVKATTRLEIDYQMLDVFGQARIFGENASGNLAAELYVGGTEASASGANWSMIYGNSSAGTYNILAGDVKRRTAVLDLNNKKCSVSDVLKDLESGAEISGESGAPLILFARTTRADGATDHPAIMRLYSFRIYEAGSLVHEYLPYRNGTVIGLKDTQTGDVFTDVRKSSTPFKVGGIGYDESDSAFYTQPQDVMVAVDGTKTLSAYAPGAISYQWYKNGEPIEGATGMALDVTWEKLKAPRTVIYTVKAKFDRYGVEIERESDPATVTMQPLGLFLIVR